MVAERYKLMRPDRRMRIASSMFETARAIIESSLPLDLIRRERPLAFAKRLYAGELPRRSDPAALKRNCELLSLRMMRNIFVKMCQRSVLSRRA